MLQKLVPSFLKHLDRYLLLHRPLLWVSKIHYLLFYSILLLVPLGIIVYCYPLTPASYLPEMETVLFFTSLVLVMPLSLYWVRLQLIYPIKELSKHWTMAYLRFGLYLTCIAIFAILPVAMTAMVKMKMANLVSDEELITDINALNIGNIYFPIESEYHYWEYEKTEMYYYEEGLVEPFTKNTSQIFIKAGFIRGTMQYIPISLVVFYPFQNRSSDINERIKEGIREQIKNTTHLARIFIQTTDKQEKLEIIKQYIQAFNKYSLWKISANENTILYHYLHNQFYQYPTWEAVAKKQIENQFDRLLQVKFREPFTDTIKVITWCGLVFLLATIVTIWVQLRSVTLTREIALLAIVNLLSVWLLPFLTYYFYKQAFSMQSVGWVTVSSLFSYFLFFVPLFHVALVRLCIAPRKT